MDIHYQNALKSIRMLATDCLTSLLCFPSHTRPLQPSSEIQHMSHFRSTAQSLGDMGSSIPSLLNSYSVLDQAQRSCQTLNQHPDFILFSHLLIGLGIVHLMHKAKHLVSQGRAKDGFFAES